MEIIDRRCLQERIGTCGGCNIQDMVLERRRLTPRNEEPELIREMTAKWCPDGAKMQISRRPESSFW